MTDTTSGQAGGGQAGGGGAAAAAAPEAGEPGDSSPQRGLIGRLLSAFSSGEAAVGADGAAAADEQPHRAPPMGMGHLRRLAVEDVAIPKVEIEAVPVTATLPEIVEAFRRSGFSRLPVYKGTLDAPQGIIHLKDFAIQQFFTDPRPRFNLRKMLRPLLYAPPSMPAATLLQKMQADRIHMALVIDEYGGVDGLVTIEDLIEQVVGEIEDEHDTLEAGLWAQEKPGQYLAQARADLTEFEAETGMKIAVSEEAEDVDTLGGLVFMLAGRIPARGEVIKHDSGVEFEVVDADPRRIKRLRVRLPQAAATGAE
jgi:magnesium and cobalt transporter